MENETKYGEGGIPLYTNEHVMFFVCKQLREWFKQWPQRLSTPGANALLDDLRTVLVKHGAREDMLP